MEELNRNLESIVAELHDKGKTAEGLRILRRFISHNSKDELDNFLRFHVPKEVRGQELIDRFKVDKLIEFYNILLIAVLAGYIPSNINDKLRYEIENILGNDYVKKYYSERYPYLMTECTLSYVRRDRLYDQKLNSNTLIAFNEFISLNRVLQKDKDMQRFLGMLDYVWYGSESEQAKLADINEILMSYEKLHKTLIAKSKNEKQRGVWGFIKFTGFISQFRELLQSVAEYPLLQSSLWMFYGYYFDRMNNQMTSILNSSIANIQKTISSPEVFTKIVNEIRAEQFLNIQDDEKIENISSESVQQVKEDLDFVLNPKWGHALKNYFNIPEN